MSIRDRLFWEAKAREMGPEFKDRLVAHVELVAVLGVLYEPEELIELGTMLVIEGTERIKQ